MPENDKLLTEIQVQLATLIERQEGIKVAVGVLASKADVDAIRDRVTKLEGSQTFVVRALLGAIITGSSSFVAGFGLLVFKLAPLFGKTAA